MGGMNTFALLVLHMEEIMPMRRSQGIEIKNIILKGSVPSHHHAYHFIFYFCVCENNNYFGPSLPNALALIVPLTH